MAHKLSWAIGRARLHPFRGTIATKCAPAQRRFSFLFMGKDLVRSRFKPVMNMEIVKPKITDIEGYVEIDLLLSAYRYVKLLVFEIVNSNFVCRLRIILDNYV